MPWSETSPMDQKTQFIADYLRRSLSISELCTNYGISRKTGYKSDTTCNLCPRTKLLPISPTAQSPVGSDTPGECLRNCQACTLRRKIDDQSIPLLPGARMTITGRCLCGAICW